ncbi:sugar ABC transporter permease [Prauserella marina]|uniref:ABC-2 type transport system permease protein n=2 Tax=Prauserella marina TaxID=530584 RepID=A0A222VJ95_9PSEU|nr:ABC transporter permease [Prauserella marina]ASR33781.1 sugar ABC transporter permease [Prauserella marina]PWV82356.1 ABC-2 type transport system permease protein [Prauserella marina]SDC67213.1 ABC-2 type transport system permease protein [Prauserella marina]
MNTAPPASDSRTWKRAVDDIKTGMSNRELWGHLGWQDIKQRYRRSVIGPFWITISQGVIALGLGLLYSQLFNLHIQTFLPYISTGFIVWTFISGCLSEGMETFISNEGLIKQMPAPLSVYALRTVWRQTLMFAHNLIVYVIIVSIFFTSLNHQYGLQEGVCTPGGICHPGLGWYTLTAIPAFVLLAINAGWVTLMLGVISTRYRDIPQVISSLIQLLFYLTPIVWPVDQLYQGGGREAVSWALPFIQFNPLYHFIQIIRAPLIGQQVSINSWFVVIGFTIVGWLLALLVMRNYRARVSYWV